MQRFLRSHRRITNGLIDVHKLLAFESNLNVKNEISYRKPTQGNMVVCLVYIFRCEHFCLKTAEYASGLL